MFDLTNNNFIIFVLFVLGSIFVFFEFFIKSNKVKKFVEGNRTKLFLLLILVISISFSYRYIRRKLHNEYMFNSWYFCKEIDCRKKSDKAPQKLKYGISEVLKGNE